MLRGDLETMVQIAVNQAKLAYGPNFTADTIVQYTVKLVYGTDVKIDTVPVNVGNWIKTIAAGAVVRDKMLSTRSTISIPLDVIYKPLPNFTKVAPAYSVPIRPTSPEGFVEYNGTTVAIPATSMKVVNAIFFNGKTARIKFPKSGANSYYVRHANALREIYKAHSPRRKLFDLLDSKGISSDLRFSDGTTPKSLGFFQNFCSSIFSVLTVNNSATLAASEITLDDTLPLEFYTVIDPNSFDVNDLISLLTAKSGTTALLAVAKVRDYFRYLFKNLESLYLANSVFVTVDGAIFARPYESPPYNSGPVGTSIASIEDMLAYAYVLGTDLMSYDTSPTPAVVTHAEIVSLLDDINANKDKADIAIKIAHLTPNGMVEDAIYRNAISWNCFKDSDEHAILITL